MTPVPAGLRVLLPLLLSLHAVSSALILPTLPLVAGAGDSGLRSWAFSALILGFGSTQILWGGLADRWGRRPALTGGLLLFVLASVGCFFAADLPLLIACRLAQGAGVAAAGVCARAIIRDLYSAQESILVLSRCFSWISAVALAGPFISGALISRYGIAGALAAYALVGALALGLTLRGLRETLQPDPLPPCGWGDIWRHPVFLCYTALTACSYSGHYLFLSNSAVLLMEQCGLSAIEYGAVLSLCSLVYLSGTVVCRRALTVFGLRPTVAAASLLGLAGGGAMALAALSGRRSAAAIVLPYMLFLLAHAIHQSCGQAAALAPFKRAAGRAGASLGTTLPLVAVGAGAMLAPGGGAALPVGIFVCSLLTAAVAWLWVRRDGDIGPY